MVEATQTILPQPSRVIAVLAKQAAIGWARLCLRGRPGRSLSSRPSKREKNDDREYSTAQPRNPRKHEPRCHGPRAPSGNQGHRATTAEAG